MHNMYFTLLEDIPTEQCKRERKYANAPPITLLGFGKVKLLKRCPGVCLVTGESKIGY